MDRTIDQFHLIIRVLVYFQVNLGVVTMLLECIQTFPQNIESKCTSLKIAIHCTNVNRLFSKSKIDFLGKYAQLPITPCHGSQMTISANQFS